MFLKSVVATLLLTSTTLGVTIPSTLVKRQEAADTAGEEAGVAADAAAAAATNLRAFDVSEPQAGFNPNFWKCTYGAGYRKAVIRGYQQACGVVCVPMPVALSCARICNIATRLTLKPYIGRSGRPQLRSGLQRRPSWRLHQHRRIHVPMWVPFHLLI